MIPGFISPVYKLLYWERECRINLLRRVFVVLYLKPIFCSRCKAVGKGFNYVKLQQNFPYISGNIQIYFGENVTFHSRSSLAAASVFDLPILEVDNNTYLGPGLTIGVGKKVSIGSGCLISSNVSISDNDGHPTDPVERAKHRALDADEFIPVTIGNNVWIGEGATILKGVDIGDCAIIAAKSVVTKNVEAYTIAGGNPVRIINKLEGRKGYRRK